LIIERVSFQQLKAHQTISFNTVYKLRVHHRKLFIEFRIGQPPLGMFIENNEV